MKVSGGPGHMASRWRSSAAPGQTIRDEGNRGGGCTWFPAASGGVRGGGELRAWEYLADVGRARAPSIVPGSRGRGEREEASRSRLRRKSGEKIRWGLDTRRLEEPEGAIPRRFVSVFPRTNPQKKKQIQE